MLGKWIKRGIAVAILAAVIAATVYAMMPQPVPVDVASIERGPLTVTIDEEGIARIRDVFQVSAPIPGKLERLPVRVGDRVYRGTSAVASIRPAEPTFLDVRARRELEAGVESARSAVTLAESQLAAAQTAEKLAESALSRAQQLAKGGTISAAAFEKVVADLDTAKAQVDQMHAALALRRSEMNSAEARLIEPDRQIAIPSRDACCLTVRAPIDGIVLKTTSESEQVVNAGTPLVEIGDPRNMEIVVHLLSSDAVGIRPPMPATIDDWGGDALRARVLRVDPGAYTKVSALGIEEQRVDAVLDLVDPYETWRKLGHDFRVMAHIRIWESQNAIRVPLGALFRVGSQWTVFKIVEDRAVLTPVTIDHRNLTFAEVTAGLAEGDVVVLHPSDRISDGVKVETRK